MALPVLDSVFASAADLPRRQMLAKWLVEELGQTQAPSNVVVSGLADTQYNGSYVYDGQLSGRPSYKFGTFIISWNGGVSWILSGDGNDTASDSDVAYPWLATGWYDEGIDPTGIVITESPAPSPLSNYYSLPERYLWAKIAVAAGGPKTEADYISLPTRYVWSDIYNAVAGLTSPSFVLVSGAGSSEANGTYTYRGEAFGKPYYNLIGEPDNDVESAIAWTGDSWVIRRFDEEILYSSSDDLGFPWLASWSANAGDEPVPTVVETPQAPNHTDWSEKQALGHIAAAYRGDTANPEALATYINWPWRYQVASIITSL